MIKHINRTDLIIIGASILSLVIFAINTMLDSVIPLYINSLIILGTFIYWSLRKDPSGMLKRGLIIGGFGGFFYSFVNRLLADARIITYLRTRDFYILSTPVSVMLNWVCYITVGIYLYLRLRSYFSRFYIPSAITGAGAFLSGIIFDFLGDRARLWIWVWNTQIMPERPLSIGPTPLFFPVALFVTFFLSPWIVGGQRIAMRLGFSANPLVGGIRCAVILGAMMYLSIRIFTG